MQTIEGQHADNGVRYAYTLNTYQWYATYDCRIHRSFFNAKKQTRDLEAFTVDGQQWYVRVKHAKGKLFVCLLSLNRDGAAAHHTFTLLNHLDAGKSVRIGKSGNLGWLRHKKLSVLAATADIDDPSAGFLDDEYFSLRLELRIKQPDNESFRASVVDESTTCEWKLKNIRDMSPSIIKSNVFRVGGCKMRLEIRRDDALAAFDRLKVYLRSTSRRPCWVNGSIRITNHRYSNNNLTQDIEEELDAAAEGRSVRVLDGRNLLVDDSDFVDDHGCLTLSVTLNGCNYRHAACEVLREKRGRGIDLTSWIDAETKMNDETKYGSGKRGAVAHAYLISRKGLNFTCEVIAFNLLSDLRWIACVTAQLCLHRSMLEKSGTRFSMKLFSLFGVAWSIAVNHKENGILESHVYATDVPAVEFDITFTLTNFENEEDNIIHFENHEAVPVQYGAWGDDFCPVRRLTESSSGFLKSGFFVIAMNMTIKADENAVDEESGVGDKLAIAKKVLDTTTEVLEIIKNILSL